MAEYIEREAALTALSMAFANEAFDEREEETVKKCMRVLHRVPTADIAPVWHGRWIWSEENECWVCSNCEAAALNNYRGNSADSNFCPNCGVKMDLEA